MVLNGKRVGPSVVNCDAQLSRSLFKTGNVGGRFGWRGKVAGTFGHRVAHSGKKRRVNFTGHVEDEHARRNVADIPQRMDRAVRDDNHIPSPYGTLLPVDGEGVGALQNAEGLIVGRMAVGRDAGSWGSGHVHETVAHLAAGMKSDEITKQVIGISLAHRRTLAEQVTL